MGDLELQAGEGQTAHELQAGANQAELTSGPNSTSHRKEWMALDRMSKGPKASQFPQLAELFRGNAHDKCKALKLYLENGSSLAECEAAFTMQRSLERVRRCWTIKQMEEAGFSESLVQYSCILRITDSRKPK